MFGVEEIHILLILKEVVIFIFLHQGYITHAGVITKLNSKIVIILVLG